MLRTNLLPKLLCFHFVFVYLGIWDWESESRLFSLEKLSVLFDLQSCFDLLGFDRL